MFRGLCWLPILAAASAGAADLSAVPDVPARLRPAAPVRDPSDAIVFTIHEVLRTPEDVAMATKAASDVWIRAWFKWRHARDYERLAWQVDAAHEAGARFGGGVTCSALYHGENGLTEAEVRDMATRGPDGRLVDAWGKAGIRHGSLSDPDYRAYVLSWCFRQMDRGVDYLFMDEINAALGAREGFDDDSLRAFRAYLIERYVDGEGWAPDDPRWRTQLKVAPSDRAVCPDGTIRRFDYRAYLKKHGLTDDPHGAANPLAGDWQRFRRRRDGRAWKSMVDAIRARAAADGRRVWISANGLAPYVDLQVLGVWGLWRVDARGRIDLARSQLADWWATVRAGRQKAGRRVPVVFFHDWGMNGYPWMKVTAAERVAWLRMRAAEIYAAGGRFAFPVRGPWDKNSLEDGILDDIVRQVTFYRRHKDLYLAGDVGGLEPLETDAPDLSLALWRCEAPARLLLHVINRRVDDAWRPVPRRDVAVAVPTGWPPKRVRIVSPDWEGERTGRAAADGDRVTVTLPEVRAYAVAVLEYDAAPAVRMASPKVRPAARWARPEQNEFRVGPDGAIAGAEALNAYLQGNLHTHLRRSPTFLVDLLRGGRMRIHVMGVASTGATLEVLLDGKCVRTIDLPDRDGRNDAGAAEYDETFTVDLPPGTKRVTVRNVGPDWAYVSWYAFDGAE